MSLKLIGKRLRWFSGYFSEKLLLLEGRRMAWQVAQLPASTELSKAGFGVFSQHDEDGIIQFLINHVPVLHKTFIEFGIDNYEESNTRFLLMNDDWQGMVLDDSPEKIAYVKAQKVSRKWDLQFRSAFITIENVNQLLSTSGFDTDLGLLSIDIDGNDYWVWEAISLLPRIVIVEYNSVLGRDPVSIPYQPDFRRTRAHYSTLYYGCSLSALAYLAEKKGYILAGSNQRGNNAFFVRKDVATSLPARTAQDAYVASHFKESRDPRGRPTHLREAERRRLISHLPVQNVITGQIAPLGT
jgi:hypothetical protein